VPEPAAPVADSAALFARLVPFSAEIVRSDKRHDAIRGIHFFPVVYTMLSTFLVRPAAHLAWMLAGASALLTGPAHASFELRLQQEARPPSVWQAQVTPSAHAFGGVILEYDASRSFVVANTGNRTLQNFDVSLQGEHDFLLTQDTCSGQTLRRGEACVFTVRFAPSAAGGLFDTVTVLSESLNEARTVELTGTGVAQIRLLQATPNPRTMPDTLLGATSASQAVTVKNAGNVPLRVSNVEVVAGASEFSRAHACNELAPGASCTVQVTMTPAASGTRSGTLHVVHNGTNSPVAVSLSGTGLEALLQSAPSTLVFADTQTGEHRVVSAQLSNPGNAALTGLQLAADAPFSIESTTCASTLGAGASCQYQVRFSPTGVQTYSPNLRVSSSQKNITVGLTGTGVSPEASLSAPSFGGVAAGSSTNVTATLANTGVGPLAVTMPAADSVTGAGFSFVSSNCPATLAVGANCSISVRLLASGTTAHAGTLSVTTSAGVKSTALLGQSQQAGLQLEPGAGYAFGTQQLGASYDSSIFTLSNPGNIAAQNLNIALPSGFSRVDASPACGTQLDADSFCRFQVRFSPASAQPYGGNVSVSATGGLQAAATVSGTGQAASASLSTPSFSSTVYGSSSTATATLSNTGVGPISVAAPAVSGADFGLYTNGCGSTLGAGASCNITVQFAPTGTTTRSGTLTVGTGAGSKSVNFSATGVRANVHLSHPSIGWGTFNLGTNSEWFPVTLTNNGTSTLVVSSVNSNSTDFVVSNGCGTVGVNGTCIIYVHFSPKASGARYGTVTIGHNGSGYTQINVSGTGANPLPSLSLSHTSAALSVTDYGMTTPYYVTLYNNGAGPASLTTSKTGASRVSITNSTCGSYLAAYSSCRFTLYAAPGGPFGSFSTTFTFSASGSNASITVSGYASQGGGGG